MIMKPLENLINSCSSGVRTHRPNFDTFTDLNLFCDYVEELSSLGIPFSTETKDDLLDLNYVLRRLSPFIPVTTKPDAKDLFIASLAGLKDTGDIDVLVRHLSWQQSDISFLCSELQGYERNLKKLDACLRQLNKLQQSCNQLRMRNAELNKVIRDLKSRKNRKL